MDVMSFEEDRILAVRRWNGSSEILAVFNLDDRAGGVFQNMPVGVWDKRFDSSDARWLGSGAVAPDTVEAAPLGAIPLQAHGVLLYEKRIED
jgi:hypothetical protein